MKVELGDGDKQQKTTLYLRFSLTPSPYYWRLTSIPLHCRRFVVVGLEHFEHTTSSKLRASEHSTWDMKRRDTWSPIPPL